MPYRDEEGALRARRLSLESEIEALGQRARELPYLEVRRRALQRELAALPDPDARPKAKPRSFERRRRPLLVGVVALVSLVSMGFGLLIALGPTVRIGDGQHYQHLVDDYPAPGATSFAEPMIPSDDPVIWPFPLSLDFVDHYPAIANNLTAGLVRLGHWNTLMGSTGSSNGLVDSSGTVLPTTAVSWHSSLSWSDMLGAYDPDRAMFGDYIAENGGPDQQGTVVVSVTGVPQLLVASTYAVVVYSDEARNPEDQVTRLEITARDVHEVFYLRDAAFKDYPLRNGTRGYVAATGTRDDRARTPAANCAIFKNLSVENFEIHVSTTARMANNAGGYLRSPLNGMQILPMTALAKTGTADAAK